MCDIDIEILSFRLDKLFSGFYCNGIMAEDQNTNSKKQQKPSPTTRFVGAVVFFAIAAGFSLLWASENEYLDLSYWFGVCGFKQRFGLPCPGCGWTHAAQMFVTGHFLQAFTVQPAAAFFCVVLSLAAIFSLHSALFGINSRFLQRIFSSKGGCILLVAACVVILAGWLVNLIRTILEN